MRLNLGCGHGRMEGYVNVDVREAPNVDFAWDLGLVSPAPWPWIREIEFIARKVEGP